MTAPPGDTGVGDPGADDAPVRALFFGSGEFALPILERLAAAPQIELVGVVTAPDRPAGRRASLTPTPVATAARARDLTLLQPASLRTPAAEEDLAALKPGVAILADYGRLVPDPILGIPGRGFLNVHPSLLPRHRGATPIPAAILDGDGETGVTLFEMDEQLDHGPIVDARSMSIPASSTAAALERELATLAAALLGDSLAPWLAGDLRARPQDESGATLTRPLRRADGHLDANRPAAALERQVRAYDPWPGTFLEVRSGRLGVRRAATAPSRAGDRPVT